jgi:hypothetical protein
MKRRASSILLVSAITAAAIIVLLAGSRVVLDILRARSSAVSGQVAEQMIQTGLDEAVLRIKRNLLNTNGEYGQDVTAVWPQQAARVRGFVAQAAPDACTRLVADPAGFSVNAPGVALTIDGECPRYGVRIQAAIRTTAAQPSYDYPAIDLPSGTKVMLPVQPGVTLAFQNLVTGGVVVVERCANTNINSCNNAQSSTATGTAVQVFSAGMNYMTITATYPGGTAAGAGVVRVSRQASPSDPTFTVGINHYRVLVTGYAANGAQRQKLYQVRQNRISGETIIWSGANIPNGASLGTNGATNGGTNGNTNGGSNGSTNGGANGGRNGGRQPSPFEFTTDVTEIQAASGDVFSVDEVGSLNSRGINTPPMGVLNEVTQLAQ